MKEQRIQISSPETSACVTFLPKYLEKKQVTVLTQALRRFFQEVIFCKDDIKKVVQSLSVNIIEEDFEKKKVVKVNFDNKPKNPDPGQDTGKKKPRKKISLHDLKDLNIGQENVLVKMNGELLTSCIFADEDLGIVECYVENETDNGYKTENGEIFTEEVHGDIVITLPKGLAWEKINAIQENNSDPD